MTQIINVNNLPQIGRPSAASSQVNPTSMRFVQIVDTTPISFVFPQGAGTSFKFGIPQTLFVDNSANNFQMTVSVQGTLHSFPVPALSSGYYNIDCIDGDTVTLTSVGISSDVVEVVFYNYTKAPIVWYKNQTTSTAVTIADGADAAEGSVADAAVTNPALNGTVIGILKGILTKINTLVLGTAVSIADGADVAQGLKADAAITNPALSGTVIAFLKGILTQLQTNKTSTAVTVADGADVTQGTTTDAAVTNSASNGTALAFIKGVVSLLSANLKVVGPGASGAALSGSPVRIAGSDGTNTQNILVDATKFYLLSSNMRPGTQVGGDSGNVANASAVATLAGSVGKTTHITGFCLSASGATAGSDVTATITGLLGGTKSYTFTFPLGAAVPAQPLTVQFSQPLAASATNTAIVVTLPAGGAGNTNATATAEGFQL